MAPPSTTEYGRGGITTQLFVDRVQRQTARVALARKA